MFCLLSTIVLMFGGFVTYTLDPQRCPSGCICTIDKIDARLSVSCETVTENSPSDYSPFPTALPHNTRVFLFRVAQEDYTIYEELVSFADITWRQVEEITLQRVRHFKLNKIRLSGVPRLRVLRLKDDTLAYVLDPSAFRLTPNIEILDLSYNPRLSLQSIVEVLEQSLPNLKYLDLCNIQNKLMEPFILSKKFAMAIENKPLITLNLSNTKVSYIEGTIMSESIRHINFSYTYTAWFPRFGLLKAFPSLEEIDLSHIAIIQEQSVFKNNDRTMSCYGDALPIKRCMINNIIIADPIYLYDYRLRVKCNTIALEELYMRYSKIRWMNVTIDITLLNLKLLDFEGNSMEYLSPKLMQKIPNLKEINLARNMLSTMVNIGNLFEGNAELEILDLSQNGLKFIPWSMFMHNTKLMTLRLQGNLLSVFHFSVEKLLMIKILDLRDNLIKFISKDTINGIESIGNEQARVKNHTCDANRFPGNESEAVSRMNNTTLCVVSKADQLAIDLTGNTMECMCDRVWLIEWILYTNISLLGKHLYTCKFDNNLNYITYELSSDIRYNCKLKEFIGAIIAIPCSIFLTTIVAYIIVRRRLKKRKKIHDDELMKRYNVNENEDRQRYFVFLSFAGEDSEFVNNYIQPKLETFVREQFGDNDNLICTGDSHFIPGRWIVEEIDRCLTMSDVIVMVVTKHFIKSEWCKYEIMLAKQKNKLMILLVKEDVYQQRIPSALKHILKLCTRATWRLENDQFVIRPDWCKIFEGMVEAIMKNGDEVEDVV